MFRFLLIGFLALCALFPERGHAMERLAMDQLLAMAKSRPDAPEFREALVKRLGDVPIKSGEAFDSNGPDFVWAVETAAQPTLVVDDQPVGAMRRIAGSTLWFYTGQLRVGDVASVSTTSSTGRNSAAPMTCRRTGRCPTRALEYRRAVFRKSSCTRASSTAACRQLLDLRARAVQPCRACRADGLAGRGALHHPQCRRAVPPLSPACTGCTKSPTI
jgi:hypothetical protein